MSLSRLLMQCLLCVALVLNGAGAAAASVRMLDMGSAPGVATDAGGDTHGIDCAGHAVATEQATSASGHDTAPDPDCCKSASCTCACVHGCATAVSMPAHTSVIIVHTHVPPARPAGHPAPALPHLIRPPIG